MNEVVVKGQGLHLNREVVVRLQSGSQGAGIRLYAGPGKDLLWQGHLQKEHILRAERTSILKLGEHEIRGTEHLFAALLGWPKVDLDIDVMDSEIPICDGSALPWVDALTQLLGRPQSLQFYDCHLQENYHFGHGYWELHPIESCALDLNISIERDGFLDRLNLRLIEPADLLPLWESRTFILEEDFRLAQQQNLLLGAKEGCGMVVRIQDGEMHVVHGGPRRNLHEVLLHKALDIVGDLALLGCQLPKLSIRIHNGGHAAHHHLMQRIQSLCP